MTERETFEKLIREGPFDDAARGAYADWLDEHDDPELAALHRSLMYPEGHARYREARKWLEDFIQLYEDSPADAGYYRDRASYDWLIAIGREALRWNHGSVGDREDVRDDLNDKLDTYWQCFSVVEGVVVNSPPSSFSCAC